MQLQIEASGADLLEIPGDGCERVAAQRKTQDRGRPPAAWRAYFRDLDPLDPGYGS